jgi:hypothetical protein
MDSTLPTLPFAQPGPLGRLLSRFPNLRLDIPFENLQVRADLTRGLVSLPVRW